MRLKMTDKKRLYEIIPDSSNIRRSLDLAEKYGAVFEYNDFMLPGYLDDRAECRRKMIFYKSLGRDCSNDTLHGAFIDISVHSEDSLIRKVSRFRVRQYFIQDCLPALMTKNIGKAGWKPMWNSGQTYWKNIRISLSIWKICLTGTVRN